MAKTLYPKNFMISGENTDPTIRTWHGDSLYLDEVQSGGKVQSRSYYMELARTNLAMKEEYTWQGNTLLSKKTIWYYEDGTVGIENTVNYQTVGNTIKADSVKVYY